MHPSQLAEGFGLTTLMWSIHSSLQIWPPMKILGKSNENLTRWWSSWTSKTCQNIIFELFAKLYLCGEQVSKPWPDPLVLTLSYPELGQSHCWAITFGLAWLGSAYGFRPGQAHYYFSIFPQLATFITFLEITSVGGETAKRWRRKIGENHIWQTYISSSSAWRCHEVLE